jgi:hypothetical protein
LDKHVPEHKISATSQEQNPGRQAKAKLFEKRLSETNFSKLVPACKVQQKFGY